MMIQSKLTRYTLSLISGSLLAVGFLTVTTATAATQELGGKVVIEPRDISTRFQNFLDFGNVKVGASGGTISLSNDGSSSTSVTGDVVVVADGEEGSLGIQGEKNHVVTVTLDETFTMAAISVAGAEELTVSTAGQGDTYTLTAENGEWNFYKIGGTLTIPGNQPADTYRGLYNATVNYQ